MDADKQANGKAASSGIIIAVARYHSKHHHQHGGVLDSPTTTASCSSRGMTSDVDDDNVGRHYHHPNEMGDDGQQLTPLPMPVRLGRVVVEDDLDEEGSNDGDVVVDNSNSNIASRLQQPSSRIRRPMVRKEQSELGAINAPSSSSKSHSSDSTTTLLRCLEQLQKLASMESTEYQQGLLDNSLPSLTAGTSSSSSAASTVAVYSSSSLSQDVNAALVQLSMSLHRLHSVAANLTAEVDGHTDDTIRLQKEMETSRRRSVMLEAAVQKLHERNLKLKKRSLEDRKVAKALAKKVQAYETQLEQQGFQLMANQVQQHEIHLLHHSGSTTTSAGGSSAEATGTGRERIDSNLSDLLMMDEEEGGDAATVSTMTTTATKSQQKLQTTTPLIFDGLEPTLCFSAQSSSTRQRSWSNCSSKNGGDDLTMATTTTSIASNSPKSPRPISSVVAGGGSDFDNHTCSSKSKSAVKTPAVSPVKRPAPAMPTLHNPFAGLLGPRPVQPYTLRMVAPFEMQYVALPLAQAEKSNSEKGEGNQIENGELVVVEDHGIMLLEEEAATSTPLERRKDSAFAVCGFVGFSEDFNCKPALGSRLLEINGKPVDPQWTIKELQQALHVKNGRKNLTFSNDRWNPEQNALLQAAIANGGNGGKSVQTNNNGTDGMAGEVPVAQPPPPRKRTTSADSVGKALHGLGNFIQNQLHTTNEEEVNVTALCTKEETKVPAIASGTEESSRRALDQQKKLTEPSRVENRRIAKPTAPKTDRINNAQARQDAGEKLKSSIKGVGKFLFIID